MKGKKTLNIKNKSTFKEAVDYKIEQFIAKGPRSIFVSLTAIFFALFLVTVLVRALILWLSGDTGIWNGDLFWKPFLQMTDPGNMEVDSSTGGWLLISTVIGGIAGIVILSSVIAFMTTTVEEIIRHIRKGSSKVLVKGHTLVLGWNEQVIEILKELIIANESEKKAHVVILGNTDNELMTEYINSHLKERKTTQIITAPGNSNNITDLERVAVQDARSIIVISEYQASADLKEKIKSDDRAIKTLMAIESCIHQKTNKPDIIIEGFTKHRLDLMRLINPNIIALNSWELMGKILLQTSVTSGLEIVIKELLSFSGSEVYFIELDQSDYNGFVGKKLYDSHNYLKNGIPIGIFNEEKTPKISINPKEDIELEDTDRLIVISSDDSDIIFQDSVDKKKNVYCDLPEIQTENKKMKTLFLGWHDIAESFINEVSDYDDEASIDIVYNSVTDLKNLEFFQPHIKSGKLRFIEKDPSNYNELKSLNPFGYNNVIILSQNIQEIDTEKIDSDTIVISLLLKKLREESGNQKTQIVTQLLNSENETILHQTSVNNFVVSNRLINMYLAQLSEEQKIGELFSELFSESGSEIYLKPSTYYFSDFPVCITFYDLMNQVRKRNEICIGFRTFSKVDDSESNYGVVINPDDKNNLIEINELDCLVVVAEDDA